MQLTRLPSKLSSGRPSVLALVGLLAIGCETEASSPRGHVLEIVGTEFQFDLPSTVTDGPTAIRFTNGGKVGLTTLP